MDEKLKKIIYIVLGCFLILFLFLFIMSSCDKKIKPSVLETRMVEKAKSYYSVHKEELPKSNSSITLALGDLVSKGIIDELDKILEDENTKYPFVCHAELNAIANFRGNKKDLLN